MALSEAEIQDQWMKSIRTLAKIRALADDDIVGVGNTIEDLMSVLEGEYTPVGLTNATARTRAGLSALISPGSIAELIDPILFDYRALLAGGGGYTDIGRIFRALYEHFITNSLTVESRNITESARTDSGTGTGAMQRLTVDENAHAMEARHVELKRFRCREDQSSGVNKEAEVFEHVGDTSSFDNLLRAATVGSGSGVNTRTFIRSKHAGSGDGGSILRNSSFSTYNASATNDFTGWVQSGGTPTQVTGSSNIYRGDPNSTTAASMKFTAATKVVQGVDSWRVSRLDPDRPYFLRIMVNKTIGTASGGNVILRLGKVSTTISISSLAANWAEIRIGSGTAKDQWFRNFNEDTLDVEIEWTGSSGYLLIDDVLFVPYDLIDGSYWCLRQTHATAPLAWLIDDELTFTDAGGLPATAQIQWHLFRGGYGYLPSTTGTPTFTEPAV